MTDNNLGFLTVGDIPDILIVSVSVQDRLIKANGGVSPNKEELVSILNNRNLGIPLQKSPERERQKKLLTK